MGILSVFFSGAPWLHQWAVHGECMKPDCPYIHDNDNKGVCGRGDEMPREPRLIYCGTVSHFAVCPFAHLCFQGVWAC